MHDKENNVNKIGQSSGIFKKGGMRDKIEWEYGKCKCKDRNAL